MDSFELNKVAGAVLGTLLFAFGTGFLAELVYHPKPAGKAGYALPGGGAEGGHGGSGGGAAAEAPKGDTIAVRLASADAEKGKGGTKPCQGCHSFEKGGPNKMGPDLWEVVGRHKGGHEGFDYSAGLKAKGGEWTYEDLDAFLTKPSEYIKGTKMSFAGIGGAQDRANVIAYLRTLADSPKPLPAADKKDEGKKDDGKPADKPAEAKPEEKKADDKKPADKPAETKPEAKPDEKKAEDKKDGDAARKVPAPETQPQRNETEPTQAPEAKPAEKPAETKPETPAEAPATEAPAKPDPSAEEKAKGQQAPETGKDQPEHK